MVDGLIASILQRHGSELTPACRQELAEAFEDLIRAPSVALGSIGPQSRATVDFADEPTSRYTWTGEPESAVSLDVDEDTPTARRLLPERYEDVALLGYGGMGQVRRVMDRVLQREVALKLVRSGASSASILRFSREAKITARLQHPGIVPIYDYGQLGDGVPFYTMPVIEGHSLASAIAGVHQASESGSWGHSWDGTGLRRLVISFLAAAEAVAYAHSFGVVHRDLKPENIMLGEFGETLVVDWGLAREGGSGADQAVSGTPSYMAPEQARGETSTVRTDVYGLGAVLYEILVGAPPYTGRDAGQVLEQVIAGPPPGVREAAQVPLPDELVELCTAAMSRDPRDRPASAREVADVVASWLDGLRKRDEAERLLASSSVLFEEVETTLGLATQRRARHEALAAEVGIHGTLEDKRRVWALEDEVETLGRTAALAEQRALQSLRAALNQVPELGRAHRQLAAYYRRQHEKAEARRDWVEAATLELLLREHDRGEHRRYLAGVGSASLRIEQRQASVEVLRWEPSDRRMRLASTGVVSRGGLRDVELATGSYVFRVRAEGFATVDVMASIGREEEWRYAPEAEAERPLPLVREGVLGPEDCFVPGGPAVVGGDMLSALQFPRQRAWVEPFVIKRTHVTNAQYIAFLDALAGSGRLEDALRWAPRERGVGGPGPVIYAQTEAGFALQPDADGDLWEPQWPVIMVDLHGALAYAGWMAEQTGRPWRVPSELEWEAAARGADGRVYPWGDHADPTWANTRDARPGVLGPSDVGVFPFDRSPYGVMDLAGNMLEWCAEPYADVPTLRSGERVNVPQAEARTGAWTGRGGDWYTPTSAMRCSRRVRIMDPEHREGTISFRLARPLLPALDC